MSFLRRAFARRRLSSGLPDYAHPASYPDLESYAYGLMVNAVSTEAARALLINANARFEAQALATPPADAWEGEQARREAQQYAALAASRRLLREIGYGSDDEPDLIPDAPGPSQAEAAAVRLFAPDGQARQLPADPRWTVRNG